VRWVMKGGEVVVDHVASGGSSRSGGSGTSENVARRLQPSDSAAAGSQPSGSADKKAIQDVVEAFLLHLGDHQWDKVASDLAPKALIVIARDRNGEWTNSYQTGDEWLAALKRNPNPVTFREPISNVVVTVDSDHLAYLRADFQVMRDGQAQSKGVDQFTLTRENGLWKISVVAYTSLPAR